ncbi:peritrophin-48-like [Homarus americanus]|uniref:Putative Chitin binding Peritrophin-A domain-containing protein 26 n=1 Tax=Homarus americanus TaxID=6706 RepID=A0A8J5JSW7_HOMAM|nr:peritrophin-48-like [Homarus americanus]KAG7163636.1 putative Chitin binding Peritrophin-A domain-containing protein 26 [Homarus americanus]
MSPSLLRLLIILVLGVAGVASEDSCLPDCTNRTAGENVPDPKNCHRYYTCLTNNEPSDVAFECEDDMKFDMNSLKCVNADNVTCSFCEPQCKYACAGMSPDETFFVANINDCTKYYLCGVYDDPFPLSCEPGTFFNGIKCVKDESQCCDPCIVVCESQFTEIADPTNCHNFYYCSQDKYYPEIDDLHTCPNGEVFSSKDSGCFYGANCTEPCVRTVL